MRHMTTITFTILFLYLLPSILTFLSSDLQEFSSYLYRSYFSKISGGRLVFFGHHSVQRQGIQFKLVAFSSCFSPELGSSVLQIIYGA